MLVQQPFVKSSTSEKYRARPIYSAVSAARELFTQPEAIHTANSYPESWLTQPSYNIHFDSAAPSLYQHSSVPQSLDLRQQYAKSFDELEQGKVPENAHPAAYSRPLSLLLSRLCPRFSQIKLHPDPNLLSKVEVI